MNRAFLFSIIQRLARYIFYIAVITIILWEYRPIQLRPHPNMWEGLLTGSHKGYTPLGYEIAPLKTILPQKGTITFLMDESYTQDKKKTEFFHGAQNYLCPLILNKKPEELTGIIYYTTDADARRRLQETGYTMIMKLAEGKGIIVKKQT